MVGLPLLVALLCAGFCQDEPRSKTGALHPCRNNARHGSDIERKGEGEGEGAVPAAGAVDDRDGKAVVGAIDVIVTSLRHFKRRPPIRFFDEHGDNLTGTHTPAHGGRPRTFMFHLITAFVG